MNPKGRTRNDCSAAAKLEKLREAMRRAEVDACLVPRADRFQCGMIAPCDERLAWLTGFTGSAGCLVATLDAAALEVDGRYDVQARLQVEAGEIEVLSGQRERLAEWISRKLPAGSAVGFDSWLHTRHDAMRIRRALDSRGIELRSVANLVDRIWKDRPDTPSGPACDYPLEYAGESRDSKIGRLSRGLGRSSVNSAILTKPESIAWLLNIRGSDVEFLPIIQAYAVLYDDCRVDLFADPGKFDSDLMEKLSRCAWIRPLDDLSSVLADLSGRVLVDHRSAPERIFEMLGERGAEIVEADDPCLRAKAAKNRVEVENHRAAQEQDGAAVAGFLAWIDRNAANGAVTEIEAASELERHRRSSEELKGLSFPTIAATGPHGAIVHYHPTPQTSRKLERGDLFLVDSGGQYLCGTTDVTRTVAVGEPTQGQCRNYTTVLKCLIALSRAQWPPDRTGRDLDAIARYALWMAGHDFEHGTGHGVGHFLAVHEGPQSISKRSSEPLAPGMIVSIEPGLYLEGRYGIRLENLALVSVRSPEGQDRREFLHFETLTFAPFDRRLIDPSGLCPSERSWLACYHSKVLAKIGPRLVGSDLEWLERACAPI